MRGKQLVKFLRAIDLISRPQGATIEELAKGLGIDRRSVYRLINVIEELGIPIYDDKPPLESKKQWKIEESYLKKLPNLKVPDLVLSLSEIIALCFMRGQTSLYRGTDIEKKINSAFTKIEAFAPSGLTENISRLKLIFIPVMKASKEYSSKEDIIDDLTDAILQQKTCQINYNSYSQERITSFKIDPLSFFENKGGLYVFIRATSFGDIRILAVERIENIEITESGFASPKGFDGEKMLSGAFDIVCDDPIGVKIWFSADQAKYVRERTWAAEQKITDEEDGSIILELKSSGKWDIIRWVLSWGEDACIVEPAEMRQEVVRQLSKAMVNYKDD